MPEALQLVFNAVLYAPLGTFTNRGCSLLPNTALKVSLASIMST